MYKSLVTLTVTILVVVSTASADKEKKGGHPMHNMTCKGEPINMKAMMTGHKECHDEVFGVSATTVNPTTMTAEARKEMMKKWMENSVCMNVCTMKKHKLLNADGTYNAEEADKWVKAVFPSGVQPAIKKAFDECASTHGKAFNMDNKCAGYKAFRDCKLAKLMEICEFKKSDAGPSSEEI
ncbi:uncharacterized protein LOC110857732 [Folsomia candida]|uniref:Uncharacterized protein n=1 Tax=Folsomia candida TaxID=158441 RepID=A0A226DHI1_FOLCA|nr:uncharacterized protein LOC110857732 [Folsomia candida]OXA44629.1 hypothetical protein Fcan01_20636 [Folsomia candida]